MLSAILYSSLIIVFLGVLWPEPFKDGNRQTRWACFIIVTIVMMVPGLVFLAEVDRGKNPSTIIWIFLIGMLANGIMLWYAGKKPETETSRNRF